jgi:hypothetical protein
LFCPKCAADNSNEQQYCRQCGLPLGAARLALEGRLSEAVERIEKGERSLKRGATVLSVFVLVAIAVALLFGISPTRFQTSSGTTVSINWEVSLFLGLLFGLPGILIGLSRIRSARRILKADDQTSRLPAAPIHLQSGQKPAKELVTAGTEPPASVSEHTTRRLESAE